MQKTKINSIIPVLLLGAGILSSLTGCRVFKVTTPYEAPKMEVPDSFRKSGDSAASRLDSFRYQIDTALNHRDSSIAKIPYADFFADKDLVALIDTAFTYNFDLKTAVNNIKIQELTFKQAKLGNQPTVDLAMNGTLERYSNNTLTGASIKSSLGRTYNYDFTLAPEASWTADIWGKIKSQKEEALASYLESKEAARTVKTQLISSIATDYYELMMLDAELDLTKETIKLYDSTLRIMEIQQKSGQTTSLAVEQELALKQSAEESIPKLEQEIAVEENAISILTGKLPGSIKRQKLITFEVPDDLPIGIPAQMVSLRPDVREAELNVRIAHANVNIAKTSLYPSLTLSAQAGLDTYKFSNWFSPNSLFGLITGGITEPLFDQKKLKTTYETSKITQLSTENTFKQTVYNAFAEVSNSLIALQKVKEQEAIEEQRVATLKKAVRNALLLYTYGETTYLDVITAESSVLSAQLNLADIRRQHLTAMATLYQSLGGGWQ